MALCSQYQQRMQHREQREQRDRDRDQRDREQRDRDRDQRDRERDHRDRDHRDRDRERDREQRDRERETGAEQGGAFRCLFCRASFGSELELQFHLPTHTRQFHCPLCQESFQVEFLLDKHMQTQHSGHQVLNGRDTPSTGSEAPGDLRDARDRKPPKTGSGKTNGDANDPLLNNNQAGASCDICERGDFASEAELAAHRKLAHHSAKAPTSGAASGGAGLGAAKNGAVSLLCAYCNENCKSRTELENHMKTHSQGTGASGKHKCNICDELCPSAAVLAEHKLTHCKVVQGSVCTVCRASVTTEELFRAHLRQHSQPGGTAPAGSTAPASGPLCLPAQCVICRQTLVSDVEVRLHARFHLQGQGGTTSGPDSTSSPEAASTAACCICLQSGETASMVSTSAAPISGQPMVSSHFSHRLLASRSGERLEGRPPIRHACYLSA